MSSPSYGGPNRAWDAEGPLQPSGAGGMVNEALHLDMPKRPDGQLSSVRADPSTLGLLRDMIADPARFDVAKIRQALEYARKEFRDPGGAVFERHVDFEEPVEGSRYYIVYRLSYYPSFHDEQVITNARLDAAAIRLPLGTVVDNALAAELLQTLREQPEEIARLETPAGTDGPLRAVTLRIPSGERVVFDDQLLDTHKIDLGSWSPTYLDFNFGDKDSILRARFAENLNWWQRRWYGDDGILLQTQPDFFTYKQRPLSVGRPVSFPQGAEPEEGRRLSIERKGKEIWVTNCGSDWYEVQVSMLDAQ
jgi:hypothetical protein